MARKGGKRGGSSAARSAAAKKGWETRRRGGAAAKPTGGARTAATRPTKSTAKPAAAPARAPKTTTARGRARTKAAEARQALKAGGGTRAARSLRTAQRAADYYKATRTGTKRSKSKGSGGSKPAKAAAAKPARGKGGAKPATQTAAKRSTGKGKGATAKLGTVPQLRQLDKVSKRGLVLSGRKAINTAAVAIRLSELDNSGGLSKLSDRQRGRARSTFNAGARILRESSRVYAQQEVRRLQLKRTRMEYDELSKSRPDLYPPMQRTRNSSRWYNQYDYRLRPFGSRRR